MSAHKTMSRDAFLLFARSSLKSYSDWAREYFTNEYDLAAQCEEHDPVFAALMRTHADNVLAMRDHLRARLLDIFGGKDKPEAKS